MGAENELKTREITIKDDGGGIFLYNFELLDCDDFRNNKITSYELFPNEL